MNTHRNKADLTISYLTKKHYCLGKTVRADIVLSTSTHYVYRNYARRNRLLNLITRRDLGAHFPVEQSNVTAEHGTDEAVDERIDHGVDGVDALQIGRDRQLD